MGCKSEIFANQSFIESGLSPNPPRVSLWLSLMTAQQSHGPEQGTVVRGKLSLEPGSLSGATHYSPIGFT